VEEAIEHVRSLPLIGDGFNLLLGDESGEVAMIERVATGHAVLRPGNGGPLVHANHLLDPQLAAANPAQEEPLYTNSRERCAFAEKKLAETERSASGMRDVLTERAGAGATWQTGGGNLHTDFAVMFLPREGAFEYRDGCSAPGAWQRVEMN
jgi:hypothetical protein